MGQTSRARSFVVPLERRILLLRVQVYGVSTKRLTKRELAATACR